LVAVHSNLRNAGRISKRYPGVKVAASEDEILNDPSIQFVASALSRSAGATRASGSSARARLLSEPARHHHSGQACRGPPGGQRTNVCSPSCTPNGLRLGLRFQGGETGEGWRHRKGGSDRETWLASGEREDPPRSGFGIRPATAASCATSIRTRRTSSCITPDRLWRNVTASQIGNVNYPHHPKFQDVWRHDAARNGGLDTVRVDWFTPMAWEYGATDRLFILGTEGYIRIAEVCGICRGAGAAITCSWWTKEEGARIWTAARWCCRFRAPQFGGHM